MPRFNCSSSATACAVALAGFVLMVAGASAQEFDGRFSMTPTKDGFIRLDKQSGAVSICANPDGQWSCRAMPDDQKALLDKLAKLEQENKTLREENRRLEDVMGLSPPDPGKGGEGKPGELPQPPGQGFKVPTEKDLDHAFDYFEGMLKKFRERLKKFDEDQQRKDDGAKEKNTVPL